jgi:hypothetical protein
MTSNEKRKAAVLKVLQRNSKPMTAFCIAMRCGIYENSESCTTTRALIRDLTGDGYSIGSSSRGYKMLTTGKEVQSYLNHLLKRQMGISQRIAAVYGAAKLEGVL